jgi:hypothetical protein
MTPEQKALHGKYQMLLAEARAVEKLCGGNSYEMEKKRDQVAAARAEYVKSLLE